MLAEKKHFAELEKNLGLTYNADGLLAEPTLRDFVFPSMTQYDVLHTYFNNGIVSVEVGLFLQRLAENGIPVVEAQTAVVAPSLL